MEKLDKIFLPQYMKDLVPSDRYYGTINRHGGMWIVKAEPLAMEFFRRIFEATYNEKNGEAMIPVTDRNTTELNWFMMRYPLELKNYKDYVEQMNKARQQYMATYAVNVKKQIELPDLKFKGVLYEYQKYGLSFLKANKHTLLADEMGLGKLVMALATIQKINQFPVIIVTPPHLMYQWTAEIHRFLGEDIRVHAINGLHPYQLPAADIYIIHYLVFRGWAEKIAELGLSVWIFDEVQELRNPDSQKYAMIDKVIKLTAPEYIFGLSGTPIYNRGWEIFNVLNVIDRGCLGTRKYFMKEWCGGSGMWGIIDKPDVLGKTLEETGKMLRRRKIEVLTELPEKQRAIQAVEFDKGLYLEAMTEYVTAMEQLPFNVDINRLELMRNIEMGARRSSGVAKAQHVAEFVKLLLEADEPVVLFGFHKLVIDLYAKYLSKYKPVFVTGLEDKNEKAKSVASFMAGETNLIILNLRTTAGLNLQRGRCVVFGELDWSPAVHQQAEDRVHRIGQKAGVMCYYLIADTASDSEIAENLELKREQFSGIMRDKVETKEQEFMSQRKAKNFMWGIAHKVMKEKGALPLLVEGVDTQPCPRCGNLMQKDGRLCWECGWSPKAKKKDDKDEGEQNG